MRVLVALILFASVAAADSGRSLYQLESNWITDSGRTVRLREFAGHYEVLLLMFTHCEGTCPVLVKQIQFSRDSMSEHDKAQLEYLLVSIDPGDDQAALQSYRKQMNLDRAHWTLLRGTQPGVRELAAVLGFNYTRDGDQFMHSNLITVLNKQGEIIHQQFGVDQSPAELAGLLGRAVEADGRRSGAAGPSD